MKNLSLALVAIVLNSLLFSCSYKPAKGITLPKIFGNNMVLQQGKSLAIWGQSMPGGKVTVEIGGNKGSVKVKKNGKWMVEMPLMSSGGPYDLKIIGEDTIVFTDVMIGEVWICSGQSNMEWPLRQVNNADMEIAGANHENIRLFKVNRSMSLTPSDSLESDSWMVCSSESVSDFSAVAYFFGRDLHENLDVPIGLIQTSWGGTPAEAWTSPSYIKEIPEFSTAVEFMQSDSFRNLYHESQLELSNWEESRHRILNDSLRMMHNWNTTNSNEITWGKMKLPVQWENAGYKNLDGIVFFRKTFELSKSMKDQNGIISLGPIDDEDSTYLNGYFIGSTYNYSKSREYKIPKGILIPGTNMLSVKVIDNGGGGGFSGTKDQMCLKAGDNTIDLSGEWDYKIGFDLSVLPRKPKALSDHRNPTVLYNAMIYPLIPYSVKGVIWYQGEANASRAYQYRSLFPLMINSWRDAWNNEELPFIYVQLANFKQRKAFPSESEWAELREAQDMTLKLPNTGMAVAIDIGDAWDIHPRNKQDVGSRLALNARALVYREDVIFSGPRYKAMKIEDDSSVRITFDHIGGGLIIKGGESLKGFALAGNDSIFYWADVRIEENSVVLSTKKVYMPIAVRYAWADNPECNLYNKEGLPAIPFRTDDWTGLTQNKK